MTKKMIPLLVVFLMVINVLTAFFASIAKAAPTDIPDYASQIPQNTDTFKYLIVNGSSGFNIGPDDKIYASDFNNNYVNVVDANGNYVRTLDYGFSNPNGIAVDSSNNVYVADQSNDRIVKFDAAGNFVSTWGSSGFADGKFSVPTALSIDHTGNYIYVVDTGNNRVQKFDLSGNFQLKFGSYGSGDGFFSNPRAIAVDASGNVYVADSGNNRVQIFSSTGGFSTKFGSSGSGDGQFSYPAGVAIDSSGNIWVADQNNSRVEEFTSGRVYVKQWGGAGEEPGQIHTPSEIHFDSQGHLWVESISERITEFQTDGTFMKIFTTSGGNPTGSLSFPYDVATDTDGNIYVADRGNARISKYNYSGAFVSTWTLVNSSPWIYGIAVDSSGNVYAVDYSNGDVEKTDSSGNHLLTFGNSGSGTLKNPWGIYIDADKVYVTDQGNNRVVEFNSTGAYVRTFGDATHLNSPSNVIKDSSGNFWVADTGNNDVVKYDSNGTYVTTLGSYGAGDGEFDYPTDIDTDSSGYLYVLDSNNSRVQKFDTNGNFLTKWGQSAAGLSSDTPGEFSYPLGFFIDDNDRFYVADGNNRIEMFTFPGYSTPAPSPSATPSPSASPAPTATPTSSSSSSDNNPPAGCSDSAPPFAPSLFAVTRTGTNATLFFSPVNTSSVGYEVLYGVTPSDNQYAASFKQGYSSGVLRYTIGSLNTEAAYTFKIRAVNNCAGGPFSTGFTSGPVPPTAAEIPALIQSEESYPPSGVLLTPAPTAPAGNYKEAAANYLIKSPTFPLITPEKASEITKVTAETGGLAVAFVATTSLISALSVIGKTLTSVYRRTGRSALKFPMDLFTSSGQWVLASAVDFIGWRKKSKGVVFNSVSKEMIGGAYLVFYSNSGNLKTTFSGKNGEYAVYPVPDKYKLTVSKNHYSFPSKIITSKAVEILTNTYVYDQDINISSKGEKISDYSIPLDPEKVKTEALRAVYRLEGMINMVLRKAGMWVAVLLMFVSGYAAVNRQPLFNLIVFATMAVFAIFSVSRRIVLRRISANERTRTSTGFPTPPRRDADISAAERS